MSPGREFARSLRVCSAATSRPRSSTCGTDAAPPELGPQRPPPPLQAEDDDLILCLGASYHHKNRVSVVRVFRELRGAGLARPARPRGPDAT